MHLMMRWQVDIRETEDYHWSILREPHSEGLKFNSEKEITRNVDKFLYDPPGDPLQRGLP